MSSDHTIFRKPTQLRVHVYFDNIMLICMIHIEYNLDFKQSF